MSSSVLLPSKLPVPTSSHKNGPLTAVFTRGEGLVDHFLQTHHPAPTEFFDVSLWGRMDSRDRTIEQAHFIRSVLALSGRETDDVLKHEFGDGHFFRFAKSFLLYRFLASKSALEATQRLLAELPQTSYSVSSPSCAFWLSTSFFANPIFAVAGRYVIQSSDGGSSLELSFASVDSPAQAGAVLTALDAARRLTLVLDNRKYHEERLLSVTVTGNLHPGTIAALSELTSLAVPRVELRQF